MHETALAKRVLDAVLDKAAGARVVAVHGSIAEDEALSRDALAFHFAAHARGTAAEGAALDLTLLHVGARCDGCGHRFLPEHHVRLCPACGSADTSLEGELGVRVDRIDVSD